VKNQEYVNALIFINKALWFLHLTIFI